MGRLKHEPPWRRACRLLWPGGVLYFSAVDVVRYFLFEVPLHSLFLLSRSNISCPSAVPEVLFEWKEGGGTVKLWVLRNHPDFYFERKPSLDGLIVDVGERCHVLSG